MGKQATQPVERAWDGIVRRSVDFEVRSINEEERSLEVTASTATLDAHGDIVEQSFKLERYNKNPVVLWIHNSFGWLDGTRAEDYLPIGHSENVRFENGNLSAKLIFIAGTAEEEPLVDKIWRRVKQRALRAVSIGFRPGRVTEEKRDGGTVYRLSENELFEISVVPIPSNPDAVAKAASREHEEFRRLLAANPTPEGEEKSMSAERIKELEDSLKTSRDEAKTATDKVSTLEKQVADMTAAAATKDVEVATEKKRAEKAESEIAVLEVKNLVGKKITPAEEAEFLELRKSNPELFRKMVDKRPDISALGESVTEKGANPAETKAKGSSRLAERAQEGAR